MKFWIRYLAPFHLSLVADSFKWFWLVSCHKNILLMLQFLKAPIVSSPPWDQGGDDFCVISQARVETAKLQEPGWGHIQGEDDFRQSSRGDCFIMTNCWYFHKMLHLEFYKFRLRCYIILNFIASILQQIYGIYQRFYLVFLQLYYVITF